MHVRVSPCVCESMNSVVSLSVTVGVNVKACVSVTVTVTVSGACWLLGGALRLVWFLFGLCSFWVYGVDDLLLV